MRTRGRKSAASLSVISGSGIEPVRRPEPPEELTDEQAGEWRSICNSLPADWFRRETYALLAQYCRHVVTSRRIAQLIEAAEAASEFDLLEYDRLGKMAERESRILASLATKMRISQQATYDKSKKKPTQAKRPWDVDGGE